MSDDYDDHKILGTEIVVGLYVRVGLTIVFTLSFLVILVYLLVKPGWPVGVMESVLTHTTYRMVDFWFKTPAKRIPKKKP